MRGRKDRGKTHEVAVAAEAPGDVDGVHLEVAVVVVLIVVESSDEEEAERERL